MFRISQAISVRIISTTGFFSSSQANVIRRWAGHSKWANIKHQKGANDAERNRVFTRLSRMIKIAVTEGKSPDPISNTKLSQVLEQCKRANMPSSTIANSIKSATTSKSSEVLDLLYIRGPGRCGFLVEIASSNLAMSRNTVASALKKHGCKFDQSVIHDFTEKGIIFCSPLNSSKNPLEDATDHAISAGVEEVIFDEETKKLKFECSPEATMKAKKALEAIGYVVDSATNEFLPTVYASLTDEQIENITKLITKIEALPEIVKITDNIE